MSDQTGALLKGVQNQDFQALARFLTVLERQGPAVLKQCPALLKPTQLAFRFGITGPPGAGKSTLIGALIRELRARGHTVAVVAVDPSSPFTQGAVLGDRIRYSDHFTDPGVFIRSLGSRGSLGGLSASTYLMVRAFDLARFDFVLIETVGVGQTELEIMHVADEVAVVLVPESGDSIQGMKAGLLEIANLYVVNKADRPGSEIFIRELESALALDPRAPTELAKVISTVALKTSGGISALLDHLLQAHSENWSTRRNAPERLRAEARAILRAQVEAEIWAKTENLNSAQELLSLIGN